MPVPLRECNRGASSAREIRDAHTASMRLFDTRRKNRNAQEKSNDLYTDARQAEHGSADVSRRRILCTTVSVRGYGTA
jgi:hypothetical protein